MLIDRPQILNIMQCANLGGMEKTTLEIMSALKQKGAHCQLVSLNPIAGLGPLLAQRELPAKGLSYRGPAGLLSIPAMASEFRQIPEPDAIIMSGHNLAAFAALAGLDCKRRLLSIHFHHTGVKSRWQWRLIYAAAMRIFPRIAFCADFIRMEAEEICPMLRDVSLTMRYPFPLPARPAQQDRQAARRALGLPESAAIIGNAGWLIPRKRWDVFLRVAAQISQLRNDVVFLICGDGPLKSELIGQCAALGLSEKVRWLGWQQDLTQFYLSLDVALFNSDWDARGRTPLEAGAYEVPVVASVLHGGLREVIASDEVGFLADRHDEEWLAEKVLLLLENDEVRRRTGAACRKVLADRYNPGRYAGEVLQLLGLEARGTP